MALVHANTAYPAGHEICTVAEGSHAALRPIHQDVRPAEDFEAYHIPGSKNVPLFVPLESNSAGKFWS